MSLAESIKSYGAKKRELVKKNKWSYYATGAGNAMMKVGAELSKFEKATAANKLSHKQFQKGAEILNIDPTQLEGTTFDTPDEETSRWGNFKEGIRERLTSAKSMTTAGDTKPDKWYNPSSWGNQADPSDSGKFIGGKDGDREYTAEEISQVGMIYGDTAKAKMARAEYNVAKGEDGKDISEIFGTKIEKSHYEINHENNDINVNKPTVEEVEPNVDPAEILINNDNKETDILKPDAAKGYENLSLSDRRLMASYFKEFGEEGPVLEKNADLEYSKTANKMRSMQRIMNELGLDVGGDAAEWAEHGRDTYGYKSKNAYDLLRTQWSGKDEEEWGYLVK
jgi:hypothetical protein